MSDGPALHHAVGDGCLSRAAGLNLLGDDPKARRAMVTAHVRSLTNTDLPAELRRAWGLRFGGGPWDLADLWLLIAREPRASQRTLEVRSPTGAHA